MKNICEVKKWISDNTDYEIDSFTWVQLKVEIELLTDATNIYTGYANKIVAFVGEICSSNVLSDLVTVENIDGQLTTIYISSNTQQFVTATTIKLGAEPFSFVGYILSLRKKSTKNNR